LYRGEGWLEVVANGGRESFRFGFGELGGVGSGCGCGFLFDRIGGL
jgi:hypothetical protein